MSLPKPTDSLAGCFWLPRLITKARRWETGLLAPALAERFCHSGGVDGQFLSFFHLAQSDIVATSRWDDAAVAEWFLSEENRRSHIVAWNELAVNLGRPGYPMAERMNEALATSYAHLGRKDFATVFEVLEADDAKLDQGIRAFAEPQTVETERLLLRQWGPADFAAFAGMSADPEVMRFFPKPLSEEESHTLAQRWRDSITDRGWGFWVAEERATGQFVGLIGLHTPIAAMPFWPCVEVGWRLIPSAWGKGLATEGAQGALRFGFEQLRLSEIVSFTAIVNEKSQAVMERIGMHRAATFSHPLLAAEHPLCPHFLYRIAGPRDLS